MSGPPTATIRRSPGASAAAAPVYADYAASAPLRPAARAAVLAALDVLARGGNPSSAHRAGAAARAALEDARAAVAAAIGAPPLEVVLTSGATEANNLALAGVAHARGRAARLAALATDHASVLAPARALAAGGHGLTVLPVDAEGGVAPAAVAAARPDLLSVALVNAETGVVVDVPALAAAVHAAGGLLHVDAAQAATTCALDVGALGADLMTLSGHKVGGPPGAGALWVARGVALAPAQHGGAQEGGLRAGTEALPALAGFAAALGEAVAVRAAEAARLGRLQATLAAGLRRAWPDVRLAGAETPRRAPHVVNATFPGLNGETLVAALDLEGVAVATGSACAAGGAEPSHVLRAMGWSRADAGAAVRVSLGWRSTEADVAAILARLTIVLDRLAPSARERRCAS